MTKPVSQVRREEQGSYDLTLSDLQRWQRALGVPAADLLVEPDEELSDSVAQRASLVKIMKTAAAICEQSSDSDARRAGEEVIQQLVELMPELKDVKPWERVGKRRGGDELGRAAEQMMAEEWILGDQPARFD